MSQISATGRHTCHAQLGDFGAGLWGQPARILSQLSPFGGGREPSKRPCRLGPWGLAPLPAPPALISWPLSGAGLPHGAPPLLPRARSERQESLGEGEECQVFVVEKICSPEFPPESTICWVFSRIMKHFLRGWRRREGLKKNGVSFLTSSLLSLEPFREASGIRRRGSGSGGGGVGGRLGVRPRVSSGSATSLMHAL